MVSIRSSGRSRRFRLAAISLVVAGALPHVALGVDATWNLNADGNWSVGGNWTTNPLVPLSAGDTARFLNVISADRTIAQNVAGVTLGAMEFNDNNGYTIGGANAITFDAPSDLPTVTINNSNGNAIHTVATNLVLTDSLTVTVNTTAAFPATFSGQISGAGALVKTGPGNLKLGGAAANTFAGGASVTQGTLELSKSISGTPAMGGTLVVGDFTGTPLTAIAITANGGVPDTSNVIVRRTGQFQVAAGDVIDQLLLNGGSTTIASGGAFLRASFVGSQGNDNTSTISGPGDLILQNATIQATEGLPDNDLVISAPISGLGFTKTGLGTAVLTGNNTYGATTISQGTLQIGNGGTSGTLGVGAITNNGTLAFAQSGSLVVSQGITGQGGLHQKGIGLTRLTGNNAYAGPTLISAGTLQIGDNGTTGSLPAGTAITNNGVIAFYRTDNITVAHDIPGTGGIHQYGSGITNLTGNVTATGQVGANFGRLVFNNSMPNTQSVFGSADGVIELASNGSAARVMRIGHATLTNTSKLDIKDNKLIVRNMPLGTATGGVYSNNSVSRLIQTGSSIGDWNGPGITTSMPAAATGVTALAVATAQQAGYETFSGVSVVGTDVLVMYTYAGDANLDGFISGDDYAAIDFNSAVPGASGWYNGDFNYDGIISGDDYAAIDFNIVAQGAPFPTGSVAGVTIVPEPAGAATLAIAAASILNRRRRL